MAEFLNITENPQTSPTRFHNPLVENEMGDKDTEIIDNADIKMLRKGYICFEQ